MRIEIATNQIGNRAVLPDRSLVPAGRDLPGIDEAPGPLLIVPKKPHGLLARQTLKPVAIAIEEQNIALHRRIAKHAAQHLDVIDIDNGKTDRLSRRIRHGKEDPPDGNILRRRAAGPGGHIHMRIVNRAGKRIGCGIPEKPFTGQRSEFGCGYGPGFQPRPDNPRNLSTAVKRNNPHLQIVCASRQNSPVNKRGGRLKTRILGVLDECRGKGRFRRERRFPLDAAVCKLHPLRQQPRLGGETLRSGSNHQFHRAAIVKEGHDRHRDKSNTDRQDHDPRLQGTRDFHCTIWQAHRPHGMTQRATVIVQQHDAGYRAF